MRKDLIFKLVIIKKLLISKSRPPTVKYFNTPLGLLISALEYKDRSPSSLFMTAKYKIRTHLRRLRNVSG